MPFTTKESKKGVREEDNGRQTPPEDACGQGRSGLNVGKKGDC